MPRLVPPLLAALGLFTFCPPATAADKPKPEAVFDAGKVWQVHLTLTAEEFAAMQPRASGGGGLFGLGAPPKPADKPDPKREVHRNTFGMDLPWAVGAVTVGEKTFDKVGVRYKGNGTIGDAARTVKKSIKIDLDRAGGEGRFGGSRTINLHCGVADPSKCRETLGYELYRAAGVPAPRTALAEVRLTVPGKYDKELLGLYTLVEEVDKPFLRDRFAADDGLLMKPEGVREFEDLGDKWERYSKAFAAKREPTKEEAARLIAFARLVHKADDATFNKEVESYLDVDGYLRFLAVTSFIANADSFFALGHNYCLYLHPKTNRLHFLPWDLDRSFSNLPVLGSNSQQMNLSFTHPYGGTHRLTERVLAAPGAGERYQKLLKELSGTTFDKAQVLKRLAAADAAVKEPMGREAKAAAARKENPAGQQAFGKPPSLAVFVEKRTASLATQLAGTSKGHLPPPFQPGLPLPMAPLLAGAMLESLDADADEKLSRDEWLAVAKRLAEVSKKDGDGKITRKALLAGVNALQASPDPGGFNLGGFIADQILTRADADKDGKLTPEELLAAAKAMFDEHDTAKAGKLDDAAFTEVVAKLLPFPPPAPPKKEKK